MSNHPNRSKTIRPREVLRQFTKKYPKAWRHVDIFRAGMGRDLPTWPEWCFLPMSAFHALLSADSGNEQLSFEKMQDLPKLSALGTWRVTQGIYRFDESLLSNLWDTPLSGDIPHEMLFRLPEWCVYVETSGKEFMGSPFRRAHWHTYWLGKGDNKKAQLKWIAPILVNDNDGELPSTIRAVE